MYSQVQARTIAVAMFSMTPSGWSETPPGPSGRLRRRFRMRFVERGHCKRRQRVQPAPRSSLACRDRRVLPSAAQQTHAFEARERPVERAVGGEKSGFVGFGDGPGELIAVKFAGAAAAQPGGCFADGQFQRDEGAGFSSAMVLAGPRVYFAMARDGMFVRAAGRVHPRFHTPAAAIVAQSVWSSVLVLSGTLAQLVTYTGFAVVLFSGVAVSALFVLRRRDAGAPRPILRARLSVGAGDLRGRERGDGGELVLAGSRPVAGRRRAHRARECRCITRSGERQRA